MALRSRFLFIASMDVDPQREDLFNEVYDTEHCPLLSRVPGVVSVSRFETQPLTMILGGETRTIVAANEPKYHALYELEGPEVDRFELEGRKPNCLTRSGWAVNA